MNTVPVTGLLGLRLTLAVNIFEAGLLNIIAICGWAGIIISKDKSKDMIWPWIIAYDLWNFAYTYNCIADHFFYANVALVVYQFNKIRKHKLNPLKDEIFTDTRAYKEVIAENT